MLTATKPAARVIAAKPERLSASARVRSPLFALEAVLFLVLSSGGGLLLWGSTFVDNMVHDQLSDQKIYFPAQGSDALDPKEFPGLQRYAGELVSSGPKAKAYANEFIAVHLEHIADGKTYAEVSTAAQANPTDTVLAGQANSLFRGETLRGLLLSVWGWSVVALIASATSLAAFAGAATVFAAATYGFLRTAGEQR